MLFIFIVKQSFSTTWSSSVSISNAIIRYGNKYQGFSTAETYGIEVGPNSNSLYILEYISSPDQMVVRKVQTDTSISWIASFQNSPWSKTLKIDLNESNIFVATSTSPIDVLKLSSSTGEFLSANRL